MSFILYWCMEYTGRDFVPLLQGLAFSVTAVVTPCSAHLMKFCPEVEKLSVLFCNTQQSVCVKTNHDFSWSVLLCGFAENKT